MSRLHRVCPRIRYIKEDWRHWFLLPLVRLWEARLLIGSVRRELSGAIWKCILKSINYVMSFLAYNKVFCRSIPWGPWFGSLESIEKEILRRIYILSCRWWGGGMTNKARSKGRGGARRRHPGETGDSAPQCNRTPGCPYHHKISKYFSIYITIAVIEGRKSSIAAHHCLRNLPRNLNNIWLGLVVNTKIGRVWREHSKLQI